MKIKGQEQIVIARAFIGMPLGMLSKASGIPMRRIIRMRGEVVKQKTCPKGYVAGG